jgi:hypothetical protein
MASTAAPYGLRPVNMLGGQVMTHGIRLYKISSGYASNIFNGDLVSLVVGGTIEKNTGTTTATPVGVFVGCEYEDAAMGLLHRQYWPSGTTPKANTTAWAYVVDDPDALFEIQADDTLGQNAIGTNAAIVQGTGSTATGNSAVALDASTIAGTGTLPLRIVDYVKRPGFSELGDAYTDVIVRINTHFNRAVAGNAAS